MAKLNVPRQKIHTHEGGVAKYINAERVLRRSVMSAMLWENEFYEDGILITDRIEATVPSVKPNVVAEMARLARSDMKLRHVPLLLARTMAGLPTHKHLVKDLLADIIQRPDELAEFLAIYWKDGKCPLSAQVKKGLAKAFTKFNEYQLAKYNRDGAIKLRDVLFLSHAKPTTTDQAELWKRLINNSLAIPDTWEVALSTGADKKETWLRLLAEKKLGAIALLRNLRNMKDAGVDEGVIKLALLSMRTDRVLPFRFIAAARHAPNMEPELESAMYRSISDINKLSGKTCLLVDVSGSMKDKLSGRSQMLRMDAACGLAVLAREMCEKVDVFTFSNNLVAIPPRRGFALRDAIVNSQRHSGTYLGATLKKLKEVCPTKYNRTIVFTDEQSADKVPDPDGVGYMVNVASAMNGVGYGAWRHIDGFSEAIFNYIQMSEG